MTIDPDRRLVHYLLNHPNNLRRIGNALRDPTARNKLAEVLYEVLDANLDSDGDPEDPDVALDLLGDALDYVLDLLEAAGGTAATTQDVELLLDAKAVADVVLTVRNDLTDDFHPVTANG